MIHDDGVSNTSANRSFGEVLAANLTRRNLLAGSLATAAATFFVPVDALAYRGGGRGRTLINFSPVTLEAGNGPMPAISPDYQYDVLVSWGDRLYPQSTVRPYLGEPGRRPTAAEQAELVGIGHDGMTFFPANGRSSEAGMLCVNHEFGGNDHVLGKASPESLEDVRLSQHAHGVSVLAIERINGRWQTVYSPNARRIHVNTPVEFSGPVVGSALLQTPTGNPSLGTLNNCADGSTPWGTYLTCEENFNGYFGATGAWTATPEQARYGFTANGFGYGWEDFDPRFDLSNPDYQNEENRFGWVVEIDPANPNAAPIKRTALGRCKHEGAAVTEGAGGRIVVYMGDDERFDYIYKFVSEDNWKSMRARGESPLDKGKLYVARFNDDGSGEWLELSIRDPRLAGRFADQAEVLTYARISADLVGATKMDRPEWTSVGPDGFVYCTLTNNSRRTVPDGANPLAPNSDGHIIRWMDTDRHTGTRFEWELFVIARDTHGTEESFASPDGLWVDPDGRVFIQTDGGQKDGLNNQMLVMDPETREIRRLLTGVTGDEITGIAYTPDRTVLFANTQHPGDGDPRASNFPAPYDGVTIPRDSTFVITRKDGGIVGS